MRIFIRVVERGSMSAAARDLGIGQPAVSERIEKLEAHLGTRLLRRNTRNMSLTQSGNVFYERSKTAVQAAEHALSVNSHGDTVDDIHYQFSSSSYIALLRRTGWRYDNGCGDHYFDKPHTG